MDWRLIPIFFDKTDIKQYGWAYYLGPYTLNYRDTNEKIVVSTPSIPRVFSYNIFFQGLLRKQNLRHLTDESSRGKMQTLLTAVTRQLTNIRADIKAMVSVRVVQLPSLTLSFRFG